MAWATPSKVIHTGLGSSHIGLGETKPKHSFTGPLLKFQEGGFVYQKTKKQEITHNEAKTTFAQDLSAQMVLFRERFHPVVKLPSVDSYTTPQDSV